MGISYAVYVSQLIRFARVSSHVAADFNTRNKYLTAKLNDHLFGKQLFIQFTASAFRKLPSIYVFSYFPFGFEGRMWDLIVSVPDHCLSFYYAWWLTHSRLTTLQTSLIARRWVGPQT